MAIIRLSQNAFNTGELSPELRRRVDVQKFFSGASQLKNMYVRAQGGARNREGFKYVADIPNASDDIVNIISFEYSKGINYLLEFTIGRMRVYKNGLPVLHNNSVYVMESELITADVIRNLYPFQIGNLCFIAYGTGQPLLLRRNSDDNWVLQEYENKNGPVGSYVGDGYLSKLTLSGETLPLISSNNYMFKSSDIGKNVRCKGTSPARSYSSPALEAGIPSTISDFNSYWESNIWYCGGALSLYTKGTWGGSILLLYSADLVKWAVFSKFDSPANEQSQNWEWTGSLAATPGYIKLYIPDLHETGTGGLRIIMQSDPFTWYFDSRIKNLVPSTASSSYFAQTHIDNLLFRNIPESTMGVISTFEYSDGITHTEDVSVLMSDTGFTTPDASSNVLLRINLNEAVNNISFYFYLYVDHLPKIAGRTAYVKLEAYYNTGIGGTETLLNSQEFYIEPSTILGAENRKSFSFSANGNCNQLLIYLGGYLWQGGGAVYNHFNVSGMNCWATLGVGTNNIVRIAIGNWGRVYPNSVALYQDRLLWGYENTIDATKTGDYFNFKASLPSVDSDALTTTVKDSRKASIMALAGGKELVAFTDISEFVFKHEVFSPSDFVLNKESYNGSCNIPPVLRENNIFYVSNANQLLNFNYSFQKDGYVSDDLTFFVTHLFDGTRITDIDFAKRYDNLVFALTDNGIINVLTFMDDENVMGWAKWELPGYKALKIAVVMEDDRDVLYTVVKKETSYKLFRLSSREENVFVDNAVVFESDTAQTTFSVPNIGADKDISVLADNNVYYARTDGSSNFTLPVSCKRVVAGERYESVCETLPVNFVMNGSETTQMSPKKVIDCRIFYTKSRGGYIRYADGNDEEFVQATQDSFGNSIGLQNGSYYLPLNGTNEADATINITQKDPLPLHITNIVMTLDIGGR